MSDFLLERGHFGYCVMKHWFLFKSSVLASVLEQHLGRGRATQPPYRRVGIEVQAPTQPLAPVGPRGKGGSSSPLASTGAPGWEGLSAAPHVAPPDPTLCLPLGGSGSPSSHPAFACVGGGGAAVFSVLLG